LLIELKAVKTLDESHRAKCINYLKATVLPLWQATPEDPAHPE